MKGINKEEFIDVMKALSPEEKRIAAALLPMNIIEEEQDKRYNAVSELLSNIDTAMEPYRAGCVSTYDEAIEIINKVVAALHEGEKKLSEETHEQLGQIGRNCEGSTECDTDHRSECEGSPEL